MTEFICKVPPGWECYFQKVRPPIDGGNDLIVVALAFIGLVATVYTVVFLLIRVIKSYD